MKATATNDRIHSTDEPVRSLDARIRGAFESGPFGPHHPYGPKNLVGGPHGPHRPHPAHEPIPFEPPAPHGPRPPHEPHLIEGPHGHGGPHGHHPVPRPRRARVSFDEEELAVALDRLGAKFLVDEVQAAPAEVKLALSLALRAPVCFMPADRGGAEEGWGNPLLDDDHLACLEDAFLVDRDRIKLELQGAPLHMTALVLAIAGYGDHGDRTVNVFGDPVPFRLDDEGGAPGAAAAAATTAAAGACGAIAATDGADATGATGTADALGATVATGVFGTAIVTDEDDAPDFSDVDVEDDDDEPEESLFIRLADAIADILGVTDDDDDDGDDFDFDFPFRHERDRACDADADDADADADDREKGAR